MYARTLKNAVSKRARPQPPSAGRMERDKMTLTYKRALIKQCFMRAFRRQHTTYGYIR